MRHYKNVYRFRYEHLRSRLSLALALNAAIIVAEFIGGWILNSIGLMSDAAITSSTRARSFLPSMPIYSRPGLPQKPEHLGITEPASLRLS